MPAKHPALAGSLLARRVVAELPMGDLLDSVIRAWRPAPREISAPPSPGLLRDLRRERNLYGDSLWAATTATPEAVQDSPSGAKVRIQRALACNRNLTPDHGKALGQMALEREDASLVLGIVASHQQLAEVLAYDPTVLGILSSREGQPGPILLARRLAHLPAQDLVLAAQSIFVDHVRRPRLGLGAIDVIAAALVRYLEDVSHDRILPAAASLAAVCRMWVPPTLGTYVRRAYTYGITGRLAVDVVSLPGEDILAIADTMDVFPQTFNEVPPDAVRLRLASEFDLDTALDFESTFDSFAASFASWPQSGQRLAARWIARQLRSFSELETFDVLARQWSGSLRDLVAVSRRLEA